MNQVTSTPQMNRERKPVSSAYACKPPKLKLELGNLGDDTEKVVLFTTKCTPSKDDSCFWLGL